MLSEFLLLLLPLSSLLSTFLFFVCVRWKTQGSYSFIVHVKTKGNPRIESQLRFICRVNISSFLGHHPPICMIQCSINCPITDSLRYNALSISNRTCRVQPQFFSNIHQ